MNTAPVSMDPRSTRMRVNKFMFKQVRDSEQKYMKATKEAMFIYLPAVVIAILENSNVKWAGIERWKDVMYKTIDECSDKPDTSIFDLLEEETGLELQLGDGKSYKDTAFGSDKIFQDIMYGQTDHAKWIRFYQVRAKWAPCTILSCCLLACHRQFHWSAEGKLSEINQRAVEIVGWYRSNRKMIWEEFERVTGHDPKWIWEPRK